MPGFTTLGGGAGSPAGFVTGGAGGFPFGSVTGLVGGSGPALGDDSNSGLPFEGGTTDFSIGSGAAFGAIKGAGLTGAMVAGARGA